MQSPEILIDQRFMLVPDRHLVIDRQTGSQTRLEPRLVKLLQLLADAAGQTVSRDQIIREIWNDYGGAEDGLNQAISFLRKILDDARKDRIKTIPKKGYLLQATITTVMEMQTDELPAGSPLSTSLQRTANRRIITALIITILVIAALFFFGRNKTAQSDIYNEPPGSVIDTTYQYKEMKEAR